MAEIDPPYRLDPLQNPVNVKWEQEAHTGGTVEGFAGVNLSATWVFSPGFSGVSFPNGSGSLRVRLIGTGVVGSEVFGVWSGGSGSGSAFTNDGDGIFKPVPGGGLLGDFHINNLAGADKGGDGSYSFDGLTFVQNGTGRTFTVAGDTTAPAYNLDNALNIPRVVLLVWQVRMIA